MLQIRSILDVADNTGAKRAAAIGVLGYLSSFLVRLLARAVIRWENI